MVQKNVEAVLPLSQHRWARFGLAIILMGTQSPISSVSAATQERNGDPDKGTSYSISQIEKAQALADSFVSKSNAVPSADVLLSPFAGLTPGQQAAQAVQVEILAVRRGGLSAAKTKTQTKQVSAVTKNGTTTTVVKYPGGETLKTVTTLDPKTGNVKNMTTHLKDAHGVTLAQGTSLFVYKPNGDVEVRTTLVEGNNTVTTVSVRRLDGSLTITGTDVSGAVGTGRKTTTFTTRVDKAGNVSRTFTTTVDGSSMKKTGVQENNVTRVTTSYATGTSINEVITRLEDGTVRTESVTRVRGWSMAYEEVRTIKTERAEGFEAALSPFEPARFYGEVLLVDSKTTRTLVIPSEVEEQIQSVAEAVGGGRANSKVPLTMTAMVGYNGGFKGSLLMSDGKPLAFTGTVNPGSIGAFNSVQFTLSFDDGRTVSVHCVLDTTTAVTTYPGGHTQDTVISHDPKTRNVAKMTTHLKDAKGKTLAKGTSLFKYRKNGNVEVTTSLTEGRHRVNTTVVRKPDGSVTITGTEITGAVGTGQLTTTFVTQIDSKGSLSRQFTTTRDGSLTRITGVQSNNVTRTRSTTGTGSWTEAVSVLLPNGTIKTESIHHVYGGSVVREVKVEKPKGYKAVLSPFEPARFIATV